MNKNQKGFAVLESLLILLIIAIAAGTGYYVWHSKNQTEKNLDNLSASNQSTTASTKKTPGTKPANPASPQRYLTIKEWGVRIPYAGSDTYSYVYDPETPEVVAIVSHNLDMKYGCSASGAGLLGRHLGSEQTLSGTTIGQDAQQNPGGYKLIGNYYYSIGHDQAACSNNVTAEAQNQANTAFAALFPKIEESAGN